MSQSFPRARASFFILLLLSQHSPGSAERLEDDPVQASPAIHTNLSLAQVDIGDSKPGGGANVGYHAGNTANGIGLAKVGAVVGGASAGGVAAVGMTVAGGVVGAFATGVAIKDLNDNYENLRTCDIKLAGTSIAFGLTGVGLSIAAVATGGTALLIAGAVVGCGALAVRNAGENVFCDVAKAQLTACVGDPPDMSKLEKCEKEFLANLVKAADDKTPAGAECDLAKQLVVEVDAVIKTVSIHEIS